MLYICQCPHRLPAKVWTAESEADLRERLELAASADLIEALSDDMRDAYVTSDPLDLFFWINLAEAPRNTGARGAFFRSVAIRLDIEELAREDMDGEDIVYRAFDDRFTWSTEGGEWRLDNQPPVEAEDLVHALAEASLIIRKVERLEQSDD